MKKIYIIIAAVMVLLLTACSHSNSNGEQSYPLLDIQENEYISSIPVSSVNDFEYEYDDIAQGIVITRYVGTSDTVHIPAIIDGQAVKTIGSQSFANMPSREGVWANPVKNVIIPDGVMVIGNGAFFAQELESISIPDSIIRIDGYAFQHCERLTEAVFDGISYDYAGIDALYIAVNNRTDLSSVILSIDNIPENPASDFAYLENPEGHGLVIYGYNGNSENVKVPAVIDGQPVTGISWGVFSQRNELKNVIIPNGVISLDTNVFWDSKNLISVTLSESVEKIGNSVFLGCTSLLEINVAEGNQHFSYENGILFDKSKETLICYPAAKAGSYTIPDSVTVIKESAFSDAVALTGIIFHSGVTEIGSSAFSGCIGLTNVIIPEGMTSIGHTAFAGCAQLVSVTLPNSMRNMGNGVFNGCPKLTQAYYRGEIYDHSNVWIAANRINGR